MTDKQPKATNIKLDHNKDQSIVTITGVITADILESYRQPALEHFKTHIKVDGFRPGKTPDSMIMQRVGDMVLTEEMGRQAISAAYPGIIIDNKLDVLGQPHIQITKIAPGSDLEFSIDVTVMPEIKFGDYKKIASKIYKSAIDTKVDDKEITEAVEQLRRMDAQHTINTLRQKDAEDTGEKFEPIKMDDVKDEDLPDYNDDFVKKLGPFQDTKDFEAKLRENLSHEKLHAEQDRRRSELIEEILKTADFTAPRPLVEYELDKIMAQQKNDMENAGLKWEDYLKSANKTEVELRTELEDLATKRAQIQLIVNHIATVENITPDDKLVQAEVEKIMEQYGKEASKFHVEAYVVQLMTNEAVFKWLANQGGSTKPQKDEK